MLRERDMETARLYGFADYVAKFQTSICQIKGIEDVDFDLSGFLSDIPEVILVPKYHIPADAPDYFEQRRAMLTEIIRIAGEFGMTRTEDRIEDMGQHFYIVTRLSKNLYSKPIRYYSPLRPVVRGGFPQTVEVRQIINYDQREFIPSIGQKAWGYIDYASELDEADAAAYNLIREVSNG